MRTSRLFMLSLLASLCHVSLDASAEAADFTGAWTTDDKACSKVFTKSGARVSFAKDSELSGGGLINEGKEIRGPAATCRIKTAKEDGDVTHMILSCATDIMYSDMQFSIKNVNANEIFRMFPNMPGMETKYYRCSL